MTSDVEKLAEIIAANERWRAKKLKTAVRKARLRGMLRGAARAFDFTGRIARIRIRRILG